MPILLFCLFLLGTQLLAAIVDEKVIICGVCKNIEAAIPCTIESITRLGEQFSDYRVVIYENNSEDNTKALMRAWADQNPRVLFISQTLKEKKLAAQLKMKMVNRTEAIARARNKVLEAIDGTEYEDYKYVVWADLDFFQIWDIEHILETILYPEQEWDAVLANGSYDLFAFRDPEFPISFELIGNLYWSINSAIGIKLAHDLHHSSSWRKVYSAFGGLGIYKKKSIKGCRYSGVVTKDLERLALLWLKEAFHKKDICFLEEYKYLLNTRKIFHLHDEILDRDKHDDLPKVFGLKLHNKHGLGQLAWFSCTEKYTLPYTCEHVPFHADMIVRGKDKIFINPRLRSPNH